MAPQRTHFIQIDPLWLDMRRIRRWSEYCDTYHAGFCHTLSRWQRVTPAENIILLDVENQCLVRLPQHQRYITLSYVWGKIPDSFQTTRANFAQLQLSGALRLRGLGCRLPATIRDAINLTGMIGQRYLWVDSLCIIQDDNTAKLEQIGKMASIYANSYLTIIAADGIDANYGLRGVGNGSLPRSYNPPTLNFSPTCTMRLGCDGETWYNKTEWHRRAWTYQERTLSNRSLVFFKEKVFWECGKARWTEELVSEPDGLSQRDNRNLAPSVYRFDYSRWPDLRKYDLLVSTYNQRLLTFPSDGLLAFSGILDVLSQTFEGGFLYGLPELFFDLSLLWRPSRSARRRLDAPGGKPSLPSWSWVGWEGSIATSSLYGEYQLIYARRDALPSIEIYPIITWFKKKVDSRERYPIGNSYHYYQRMRYDTSLLLPSGWTRIPLEPLHPLGSPPSSLQVSNIYQHEDIPGLDFVQPIPIPAEPLKPQRLADWDVLLQIQTSHAFFSTGSKLENSSRGSIYFDKDGAEPAYAMRCTLFDMTSNCVGMLYLNSSRESDIIQGQLCELIVISGAVAYADRKNHMKDIMLPEWNLIDDVRDKKIYEYYNVLWIEWKGKIAYRNALGRVWKSAWHRQTVEQIDVVLG